MAANNAKCQRIWISRLLGVLTGRKLGPFELNVDNKSALDLMKNPVFHGRSKHIDKRYHFIRDHIERGNVIVKHVNTNEQKANILTKPMNKVKF